MKFVTNALQKALQIKHLKGWGRKAYVVLSQTNIWFKFFKDIFCYQRHRNTGQLVERKCACIWSGRSEVQISSQSNRTQCCQRLATASTIFRKKLCCRVAMMRRWVEQTRYTLLRTTASIMKDLVLI